MDTANFIFLFCGCRLFLVMCFFLFLFFVKNNNKFINQLFIGSWQLKLCEVFPCMVVLTASKRISSIKISPRSVEIVGSHGSSAFTFYESVQDLYVGDVLLGTPVTG